MKKAFTLAEVLITLGIIGIVATLTMPALVANYQKQQTIVQLKKAYSELSQAVKLSQVDNGEEWDTPDAQEYYEKYLKDYLKVLKAEPRSATTTTLVYKNLSGNNVDGSVGLTDPNAFVITLPNGTNISLGAGETTQGKNKLTVIDLNGFKPPNTLGKDVFMFSITPTGVQPACSVTTSTYYPGDDGTREDFLGTAKAGFCNKNSGGNAGYCCSSVIMLDGWEIKDDYPW